MNIVKKQPARCFLECRLLLVYANLFRHYCVNAFAPFLSGCAVQKRSLKTVFAELRDFRCAQIERLLQGGEVVVHIAAEIGRVVRIDGNQHAALQQAVQVVLRQIIHHFQLQIAQAAFNSKNEYFNLPATLALVMPNDIGKYACNNSCRHNLGVSSGT